jgi:hypothetical protein
VPPGLIGYPYSEPAQTFSVNYKHSLPANLRMLNLRAGKKGIAAAMPFRLLTNPT